MLNVFQVSPTLDVFASRNTARLDRYMTWYPDKQAVAQDALLHPWDEVSYLFPTVPLLPKVLKMVREQGISAILVCPKWPSALWWPTVLEMMVGPPLLLPYYKRILTTVDGSPLQPYLEPLVGVLISAKTMQSDTKIQL